MIRRNEPASSTMPHHTTTPEREYLIHQTIAGAILMIRSPRGIRAIYLGDSEQELMSTLATKFNVDEMSRVSALDAAPLIEWLEHLLHASCPTAPQALDIHGTPFQRKVWNHLMTIPRGETQTYSQVAQAIGQPTATRAVARACATNELSLAIPCHRVIHTSRGRSGYRWGTGIKKILLDLERQ